ncbi:hypothetical protein [Streptomyces sp. RK9]|uniref:hypothetical protein n=1 Tax=Streptomyces sp. RK9 TaxID=3239284 RepID=UPI0038655083
MRFILKATAREAIDLEYSKLADRLGPRHQPLPLPLTDELPSGWDEADRRGPPTQPDPAVLNALLVGPVFAWLYLLSESPSDSLR